MGAAVALVGRGPLGIGAFFPPVPLSPSCAGTLPRRTILFPVHYQIFSIFKVFERKNASHRGRVKTPVVVPTAWTQLAPRALARCRQPGTSRPSSRPAM